MVASNSAIYDPILFRLVTAMSILKRVGYCLSAIALSTEQTFKTGVVSPFAFPDVEIPVQRLMNQP